MERVGHLFSKETISGKGACDIRGFNRDFDVFKVEVF
jgi:hypothetical protein